MIHYIPVLFDYLGSCSVVVDPFWWSVVLHYIHYGSRLMMSEVCWWLSRYLIPWCPIGIVHCIVLFLGKHEGMMLPWCYWCSCWLIHYSMICWHYYPLLIHSMTIQYGIPFLTVFYDFIVVHLEVVLTGIQYSVFYYRSTVFWWYSVFCAIILIYSCGILHSIDQRNYSDVVLTYYFVILHSLFYYHSLWKFRGRRTTFRDPIYSSISFLTLLISFPLPSVISAVVFHSTFFSCCYSIRFVSHSYLELIPILRYLPFPLF